MARSAVLPVTVLVGSLLRGIPKGVEQQSIKAHIPDTDLRVLFSIGV